MPGPVQIQQASSASSAAAPAAFTTAAFTATLAGSTLVAVVSCATSGVITINTPASFTLAGSQQNAGNTLFMGLYFRANAPAGTTTIVFPTLANVNGIAVAVYEIANLAPSPADGTVGGGVVNSSATVGPATSAVSQSNECVIGAEADVTGQAFTNTSTGLFTSGTTATSTNGATNCIIRPFAAFPGPAKPSGGSLQIGGTLAGALANGAISQAFFSTLSAIYAYGSGGAVLVSQGAGYAVGV